MWTQKVPGGGVVALAYAPDGRTLYVLSGSQYITAWDTVSRTGTPVAFAELTAPVTRLATSGAGRYLLAHSVHWAVWDTESRVAVATVRSWRLDSLAFEANTATFLRFGKSDVRRWDLLTQQPLEVVAQWQVPEPVRGAELSPDLRRVAVIAMKGNVYVGDAAGAGPLAKLSLPEPIHNGIGVRFSPDGEALAVLHHKLMYLWNMANNRVRARALWSDPAPEWKLTFHPTAPVFAALDPQQNLALFSLHTGDPIRSFNFKIGRVQCVAFAPDGLTCAVGGSNKQFAVFDVDV